jgi:tetratricopeptide (TPR) repeat protein
MLGVVLVATLPAPLAAQSPPSLTREQALGQLRASETEERRRGVAWLAELGQMPDVPALVQALRDPDLVVRRLAQQSIWQVWSRSGDEDVDALFQTGVVQMSRGDLDEATATFTRIIERKPDFAEGWNKRATVYYLAGEYDKSLRDCDEVMKRNPLHFGALSGYGQIHLQLGQPDKALPYFERALAINPTLGQVEAVIEQLKRVLRQRKPEAAHERRELG